MSEHLVRLKVKHGFIDFYREENNEVRICHGNQCVILPHCTGQQTVDLVALLEPFGEIEEEKIDGET